MVFTYVNPAVAVALGVAVLGEPLTVEIVAAFVLILAGSVLATRPGQRGMPSPRRAGLPPPEEPAGNTRVGPQPGALDSPG
jgi:drug/metabolite transporter (DMT)-like permease